MKHNPSFILLLILIITSSLSIFILSTWHKSSLLFSVNLEREKFYKAFHLSQSLFDISLILIKENFDNCYEKIKKGDGFIFIDCSSWIKKLNTIESKQAFLELKPVLQGKDKKKIQIALTLKEGSNNLCRLSCLVTKEKDGICFAEHFTINDYL